MKNIEAAANAVQRMDRHLRTELLLKDGTVPPQKLWENTYIKKQIDRRKSGGAFTLKDHVRGMVYSMITSGAPWSRLEDSIDMATGQIASIDEIFFQYDIDTLKNTDPAYLVERLLAQKLGTPYSDKQMNALVHVNIEKLLRLERTYGSIDSFYQKFIQADPSIKTLVKELSAYGKPTKFAQLGEALTAEYLRNVGYDIAKPDRHIRRILGRDTLGCSDSQTVPIYEAFDIVSEIAKAAGKCAAEVDYILWSYCAKGFGEICTVRNPKCRQCVARNICKNIGG